MTVQVIVFKCYVYSEWELLFKWCDVSRSFSCLRQVCCYLVIARNQRRSWWYTDTNIYGIVVYGEMADLGQYSRASYDISWYRRLQIGRDGHLGQSEAYDIMQLLRKYAPSWSQRKSQNVPQCQPTCVRYNTCIMTYRSVVSHSN